MGVLTDDQIERVIRGFLKGMGRPCREDEIQEAVDWARQARIEWAMVETVLSGDVVFRKRDDGEWEFQAVGGD